jgi:hypothetical protein
MKGSFRLENPGDMDATLTLTMPVDKWKRLIDCIDDKWPGWEFRGVVADMVNAAWKAYYADTPVER